MKLVCLVLSILLLFSCKQQKDKYVCHISDERPNCRAIRNYNIKNFDSLGNGFYRNHSGEIFEMKEAFHVNRMNVPTTTVYLDSIFFVGEKEELLKNFIDISSYAVEPTLNHSRDKNHVYYSFINSDGGSRHLIKDADPKKFIALSMHWGKDSKKVFYQCKELSCADSKSFRIFGEFGDSAQDKNHIYYQGEIIK